MSNSAAFGYIVKASQLTSLLPQVQRAKYKRLIRQQDTESLDNLLGTHLPERCPDFESVFVVGDEWESEDLRRGEVYVEFSEDLLFKPREETFAMQFMRKVKAEPKMQRWVEFG